MREYRVKPIESLSRGLHVLEVLRGMRAASPHDLHRATGIPKPTLIRILWTAHRHGLVWRRMVDGAFLPAHTLQPRSAEDDEAWLVEIASPVLEELSRRLQWPSVLAVPRLDHMETLETNSSRTYFDVLPRRPHGFRVNVLRSASGRAYLAFCPPGERAAVLARLRQRDVPAHRLAFDAPELERVLAATRERGYGVRAADFGGDYARPRAEVDDGRESIAVPVRFGERVAGTINLTWRRQVLSRTGMVQRHLPDLRAAVRTVEERARAAGLSGPGPHRDPRPRTG
ncbi:IclR family transcriptional regulator domain-containing protein [Geodermatophilus marinus]|uniref:IclR family transcriptional regulator domain-containing protein n=1 Tax=Geodermatophilus sp. LHW52908 TaxID=2303986 RepID=UPI000E3C763C|nr:helix-turn-helix domain-containing protein [Geodermatophilus sp. LHW52908]RFU20341.1 transcriptional regulator [Geodermatophilus sp. LHW52908]